MWIEIIHAKYSVNCRNFHAGRPRWCRNLICITLSSITSTLYLFKLRKLMRQLKVLLFTFGRSAFKSQCNILYNVTFNTIFLCLQITKITQTNTYKRVAGFTSTLLTLATNPLNTFSQNFFYFSIVISYYFPLKSPK